MALNQDGQWPWIEFIESTRSVMNASKLKAQAARRQVVADTLRTCVVSEFTTNSGNDEQLGEFLYDLDGARGSFAILSFRHSHYPGEPTFSVSTRRDDGGAANSPDNLWTPTSGSIDISLNKYSDVYSAEDALTELPHEGTLLDTRSIKSITKTIPWYDEFVESIKLKAVPALNRISHLTRVNFIKLKILYWRLASLYYSMYNHYWNPLIANEKRKILNANFPKGILGFRALLNPQDPRALRALIMKQEDLKRAGGRHPQIMNSSLNRVPKTIDDVGVIAPDDTTAASDTEQPPIEKYATLPDLKQVWNVKKFFPRVRFVDNNRFVENMAQMENDSMESMAYWSLGEVRGFLERLAVHGKNFKRIATAIPEKTERDCVEFYYRFKIHLGMKNVIAAGSQSRQDRRKGGSVETVQITSGGIPAAGNYKILVDAIMDKLVTDLASSEYLSSNSMEILNIKKLREITFPAAQENKIDGGDESPKRERRNAMMDIIGEAIARGQPIPQELGVFDSTTTPISFTPPLLMPATEAAIGTSTSRRPSLTLVKTETSVLKSNSVTSISHAVISDTDNGSRTLQSHYTV